MNTIEILIAVDVDGALFTGDLNNNVYMVDNRGNFSLPFFPSTKEGTHELTTSCQIQSRINWRVVPVDPNTKVSIFSFEGEAIPKVIHPHKEGENWRGTIANDVLIGSKHQYTATLELGSHHTKMKFDPFLFISPVILPTV
jgi:hypothetical protein